MAVENLTATARSGAIGTAFTGGAGGNVKSCTATVEVTAAASATSTYDFFDIPTDARILGSSEITFDALGNQSDAAPTLDIGLAAVNSNFTTDDDCLNDGLDPETAGPLRVIKDRANYGKKAWEFVSGLTADPGGRATLRVTVKDAAVNVGGTITVQLDYVVD